MSADEKQFPSLVHLAANKEENFQQFPVSGEFVAVFHTKYGNELPRIRRTEKFSFTKLKESEDLKGTKPAGTFRYRNCLYLWNTRAVTKFNDKGLPIINYIEGKTEPFIDAGAEKLDRVNAVLFDKTFGRGEMRSVIAGSQKPKDDWDRKTLIVGALLGAGLMFIITTIMHAYGVNV